MLNKKIFFSAFALLTVANLTAGEITTEEIAEIQPLIDCLFLDGGSEVVTLDFPLPFFNSTSKSTFHIEGCSDAEFIGYEHDDYGGTVMTIKVPKLILQGKWKVSVNTIGKRPTIVLSEGMICFSDVYFTILMEGCQRQVYSYIGAVDNIKLHPSILEHAANKKEINHVLNELKSNLNAFARETIWSAGSFIVDCILSKLKN